MLQKNDRTSLFIDGPNLYAAKRNLELDIDYRKLLDYFRERCRLIRAHYYTTLYPDQEALRHLTDWLDYNGYHVVTRRPKEYFNEGKRKVKNDMEIELIIDVLEAAPYLDHIVLFSGNGDLSRLTTSLQRSGKLVSIVSTLESDPPMVSDDLRRHADNFIELEALRGDIQREWDGKPDSDAPQAYDPDEDDE
ncbi:MAG: NYN domain-containing protein [Hyphomicrobiales bacterium]|nr:NYN domain-containing protein [Hyphomicrobiales bacterium]MCY4054025.1 NYN domain-containing protein [Hyphomicrobiales bacterium]